MPCSSLLPSYLSFSLIVQQRKAGSASTFTASSWAIKNRNWEQRPRPPALLWRSHNGGRRPRICGRPAAVHRTDNRRARTQAPATVEAAPSSATDAAPSRRARLPATVGGPRAGAAPWGACARSGRGLPLLPGAPSTGYHTARVAAASPRTRPPVPSPFPTPNCSAKPSSRANRSAEPGAMSSPAGLSCWPSCGLENRLLDSATFFFFFFTVSRLVEAVPVFCPCSRSASHRGSAGRSKRGYGAVVESGRFCTRQPA